MAAKRTRSTGDDLAEDWWVDEGEHGSSNSKTAPKKMKETVGEDDRVSVLPQKKKKKKKTMEKKVQKDKLYSFEEQHSAAWQNRMLSAALEKYFGKKLTEFETDQIVLGESCFVDASDHHPEGEDSEKNFTPFFRAVYHKWGKHLSKLKDNGHPLVLLIGSAALRLQTLNREIRPALGKCVVAKLFAKHIKISEQESFLQSKVTGFALGTPNRVAKLIASGHLNLSRLKLVVFDWYWRDQKQRRMEDIPEVWGEIAELLRCHLIQRLRRGKTKIVLF